MNRISRHTLYGAFALTLLSACDKKLDLQPYQSIDAATALTTSKDVEATLLGAYSGLGGYYLYGGQIQLTADLMADDKEISWGGTFVDPGQFYDKTLLKNNGFVQRIWTDAYNVINGCNSVLATMSKVDAAKKNRIEGEARFIRGSLYFELVKLFGKTWGDGDNAANPGVPLVTTPTNLTPTSEDLAALALRRNSVAEVYAQVLDDLTKAESLLPDAATTTTSGKMTGQATKWAAAAMLSRVYLMQLNYAGARDAANRVINSKKYALNELYEFSFNNVNQNSPENIFSTQVTSQDGDNSLRTFYSIDERGDIEILRKHVLLYEDGDDRLSLFGVSGGSIYTFKYNAQFSNVPILRLAEMYLTRAEANFRLGTSVGDSPLNDVNLIRARANLGALASTALNLAAILKERKLELMFEGQLLYDLKRTRRPVGTIAWNSERLVYPVPQRETDVNKNLTQNPGY